MVLAAFRLAANWRMCKKQQMGWSRAGAQYLLHVKTAIINGRLGIIQYLRTRLRAFRWKGIPFFFSTPHLSSRQE